jgi:hypothetical protein
MQRNGQKVAVARSLDSHQGVMLMRKAFAIAVFIGIVALIAYHLSRPKPLRPIVATWQEVGRVDAIVDLDADGNDELLVQDKSGQWWWVQFRPTVPIRQKIPAPKNANRFNIPVRQMLAFEHHENGEWHMGEVPERNANEIWRVRRGRDWMVGGWASPPNWQKWLWEKIGQPLQHFFPFLHEPQGRVFVYGWDGKRRWALLGRWREGNFLGVKLADMDGDGKQEVSIAFPKRVLVAKFEDGRWHTGWVEVPFANYEPIRGFFGFRYGGREWAIYQDKGSHRCVAIALEGDSQQSKRHQPQRRD